MVRRDLQDLPEVPVAPPYALRGYRPGDAATWVQVHREAEPHHHVSEDLFFREFGRDEGPLRDRQLFLADETGAAIGTATAWWNDSYRGLPHGRIHWVAVVPRMQGRGLSKVLVSALCQRFRELGHCRAYLTTETVRLRAIRLYLGFGFVPDIDRDDAADLRAWQQVRRQGIDVPI